MLRYFVFVCGLLLSFMEVTHGFSQSMIPVPDHIVVVLLENHSYMQIIGSSAAPNINALANDPNAALFTKSYGIAHPSQPNYLDLYSGCNQGVTNDLIPVTIPFTSANLGRELLDAGKSYTTFSEDLPSVGYNGSTSGNYARKHNPAANWMGTGTNQIPTTTNQPYSAFPSTDFSLLPTVCFVIPNQNHDMHNGTDPSRITNADTWLFTNMNAYIQWAKTNKSLFILTFDEDDDHNGNHILTIFNGQAVKGGQYDETINHYSILRTIEDMYGLTHACNASTATAITNCWNVISAVNETDSNPPLFSVYPNPVNDEFIIQIDHPSPGKIALLELYSLMGEKVYSTEIQTAAPERINLRNISPGIYFLKVNDGEKMYGQKIVVR